MMRVKLKQGAPVAYWEHAEKQCLNVANDIIDVSDDNCKFLLRNDYAVLIKNLPKKTGPNKPLKFGDKVIVNKRKAIVLKDEIDFIRVVYPIGRVEWCDKTFDDFTMKRGWK